MSYNFRCIIDLVMFFVRGSRRVELNALNLSMIVYRILILYCVALEFVWKIIWMKTRFSLNYGNFHFE